MNFKEINKQMNEFREEKISEIDELDDKIISEIIYTEFDSLYKVTSNLLKNEIGVCFEDGTNAEFRPETQEILFSTKALYDIDKVKFLIECNDNIIQPIYRGGVNGRINE